jgi:peptide/nickel transport system permease protein
MLETSGSNVLAGTAGARLPRRFRRRDEASGWHAGRWFLWRLIVGVGILVVVSIIVFAATQALPSNPARVILGRGATPQSVAALEHQLGLNRPVVTQYLSWLGGVVHGDFGQSLDTHQSVGSLIASRSVNSLTLLVLAAVIVFPLSVFLGIVSAVSQSRGDRILWVNGVVLSAMPDFVIGIALVLIFSVSLLHLFPAVALVPPGTSPLDQPNALVLPVTALVLLNAPYLYRLVRASMLDALASEYVAMAILKGMPRRITVVRHALRNAMLPVIQGSGLVLGWLLGGAVVIENVYQYPGLGSALTQSVANRDIPTIQGVVVVLAAAIVLFNVLADALTIYLTPKLRTGAGS